MTEKRRVKVYAKPTESKSIRCGRKVKQSKESIKKRHPKTSVDKTPKAKIKTVPRLKICLAILRYRYDPLKKPTDLIDAYCKETGRIQPRPERIPDFLLNVFNSGRCVIVNDNNKKRLYKEKKARVISFYMTPEWRKLRIKVLRKYGRSCMKCNDTKKIHVDHIKPRSLFPELEMDFENLQVLCKVCNEEKSNHHYTDYRSNKKSASSEAP
jgi:5-methylcytosine-specific restriction endonuclease McrA